MKSWTKMRFITGGGQHMYSYEERIKTVKLYNQYDKSYAYIFGEVGYPPSSHSFDTSLGRKSVVLVPKCTIQKTNDI